MSMIDAADLDTAKVEIDIARSNLTNAMRHETNTTALIHANAALDALERAAAALNPEKEGTEP